MRRTRRRRPPGVSGALRCINPSWVSVSLRQLHTRPGGNSLSGCQQRPRAQQLVGIESSHMSQQLGVLRRAALVRPRKDGLTVYYSLTDARIAEILQLARDILVTYLRE